MVRHGGPPRVLLHAVDWIAKHSRASGTQIYPWYLPTIVPRVPQCCSSRSTPTSAELVWGAHLSLRVTRKSHTAHSTGREILPDFPSCFSRLVCFAGEALPAGLCSKGFPCSMTSCRELPWLMDNTDFFW